MQCREIIRALEQLAPKKLAESWDNVGLLVGREDQEVYRIMIALDATEEVIDQAVAGNVDLLITHHPMLFSPIKRVDYKDVTGRKLMKLIQNNIACYAIHTNFDVEVMAEEAAKKLELSHRRVLEKTYEESLYKLVVYTPVGSEEKVRAAITKEGAGHIGKYSDCTFGAQGVGTFMPLEGTTPYIGEKDKLEFTQEVRLETIVPKDKLDATIQSMIRVHPYEEVAYDVYKLENTYHEKGIGCYGYLKEDMDLRALANYVKEVFHLEHVRVTGTLDKKVAKVAICPGAGKSLIKAALKAKADVYIAGDMDHHAVLDAIEEGLLIIDAGHFGTEYFFVDYIRSYLQEFLYKADSSCIGVADEIQITIAKENNPFTII